ncbi:hypothetical protein CTI12_AA175940 [Artemisia annua]|uniref:Uncharacterized protein n=1 Tax=Artemisia annua TaxID=35608 RepID=A0A2U1PAB0_ARTAN|nr:hypothetical protein CTI12_AA175940 [Artemisia annua]
MEDIMVYEYLVMEHKENKRYEKSCTEKMVISENDDEYDNYEVSLTKFQAICDTHKSRRRSEWKKELFLSDPYENFNAIVCNLPTIDTLLQSEPHTTMPICSFKSYEDAKFNIFNIDADLFSWETPLESIFKEFKRLSSIEDDLFTYDLLMSYTKDELLLLWPIIESKGLVWTTIEEKDRKFQIEYMNSNHAITKSND